MVRLVRANAHKFSSLSHSILVKVWLPPLVSVTKMAKINYSFEKRQKEIAKKKKKEEKLREKQLAKGTSQTGASEEGETTQEGQSNGQAQGEGGASAPEGSA